jgi:hypothetical protein
MQYSLDGRPDPSDEIGGREIRYRIAAAHLATVGLYDFATDDIASSSSFDEYVRSDGFEEPMWSVLVEDQRVIDAG